MADHDDLVLARHLGDLGPVRLRVDSEVSRPSTFIRPFFLFRRRQKSCSDFVVSQGYQKSALLDR